MGRQEGNGEITMGDKRINTSHRLQECGATQSRRELGNHGLAQVCEVQSYHELSATSYSESKASCICTLFYSTVLLQHSALTAQKTK